MDWTAVLRTVRPLASRLGEAGTGLRPGAVVVRMVVLLAVAAAACDDGVLRLVCDGDRGAETAGPVAVPGAARS